MSVNEMLMAAAGASGTAPEYVDSVFSTYLYTGNGSTQTITNGIDLAGKGGLVWLKSRNDTYSNVLSDTVRGANKCVLSNAADAEFTTTNDITSFTSTGFTVGNAGRVNASTINFCSWTFREAPKFFDVVTYTGNGANRTISHNLGSVPGMIIIKCTSSADGWRVYHRSTGAGQFGALNGTSAFASSTTIWNNTTPTSTVFSLGAVDEVNRDTSTYVAYLFAHDAGGFGEAGTDNVISCGSFTTSGGAATINLGYEPQYVLTKSLDGPSSNGGAWIIADTMRQASETNFELIQANSSAAAAVLGIPFVVPKATGFNVESFGAGTYIYMAIRRPMKTPTTGTEVFAADIGSSSGNITFDAGFPVDLIMYKARTATGELPVWDRLRGGTYLSTNDTDAETADTNAKFDSNTKWYYTSAINFSDYIGWLFKRAPGFFDIVCYTGGNATNTRVTHNLGVAPELLIVKPRSATGSWGVYVSSEGRSKYMLLNSTLASTSFTNAWGTADPTTTDFGINDSGSGFGYGTATMVAYLFSSVNGVSKVGSYTGNGTNQTINCGFTNGARFVLVKATSTTGDWVVLDTARGIVSGNDPFLQLNSTAAEVTNEDIVDPANSGFVVNSTTEAINTNGVTYIYLAIA